MEKAGFAHGAFDAVGDFYADFGDQFFGGLGGVVTQDVRNRVGEIETLAERQVAEGFNLTYARGALLK